MPVRKIHQFFFKFDPLRTFEDYPLFVRSRDLWRGMEGWSYNLWDEALVEALITKHCPDMLQVYNALRYAIQRVDFAKWGVRGIVVRRGGNGRVRTGQATIALAPHARRRMNAGVAVIGITGA